MLMSVVSRSILVSFRAADIGCRKLVPYLHWQKESSSGAGEGPLCKTTVIQRSANISSHPFLYCFLCFID